MARFNKGIEERIKGANSRLAPENPTHVFENIESLVGHGAFGVDFKESERDIFGAVKVLSFDGSNDVGCVGMEEGGVGCHASVDVEENFVGVSVAWEACGGVEELEGGVWVTLGFKKLEKMVRRERLGKVHHGTAKTN